MTGAEESVNSSAPQHVGLTQVSQGHWLRKLCGFMGPGYLIAVGYMDPGNWATDLAAGSGFGYSLLWIIMLCLPFPYIANTAGWLTAEVGRQPWLVYGLMRTSVGYSSNVSAGNGLFTLLGFMGLYAFLAIFFLFLVHREIDHGPTLHPNVEPQPITVSGD